MERTISGMMGKGSVNHNTRAFSAKNVDKERSRDNVEFCHEDIKAVYHELFDEALERYNAKQKRSDRKIENYYEKIRQGKQEKLFYEVIFQIGNRDDMNARSEEGQLAKQILIDFMTDFQSRMVIYTGILHIIHIPSQSQIIMSLQTIGLQLTRTELRMMVVRLQMIRRRSLSA